MPRIDPATLQLTNEHVVSINRVAKVVRGGRHFSFTAVVVVGDGKGHVGAGLGKANEVPDAIRKGTEDAKKHIIRVPLIGTTLPHAIFAKYGAAKILLRPALPGTGIIAGGGVRAVLEAAGVRDVLTKSLGSSNPINVVRATMLALSRIKDPEEEAERRGKPLEKLLSKKAIEALQAAKEEAATAPVVEEEPVRVERAPRTTSGRREGRSSRSGRSNSGGRSGRGGRAGQSHPSSMVTPGEEDVSE